MYCVSYFTIRLCMLILPEIYVLCIAIITCFVTNDEIKMVDQYNSTHLDT